MPVRIPLSQIPYQTVNAILDDQNCTITVRWQQVHLYMDLSVGSTVIFQGAVCLNKTDVKQSPTPDFTGTIHFMDMEGDEAPEWSGLFNGTSGRWHCVYVPEGEEMPPNLMD